MSGTKPDISVVISTHNRASRLASLLETLAGQTVSTDRFEVVVVDDASTDETSSALRRESERGRLRLRVLRRNRAEGPAAARNDGWRAATAELIAFIDDDCVAVPSWLEHGLAACASHPGAIIQGHVDPIPAERPLISPFTRTLRIHDAGPYYQTCNIFYSRALLEELGGFDPIFTMPGGEDTDLAWRAISRGTPTAFACDAQAYHAVNRLGPLGRLRLAAHWHESMLVYKRYPELRKVVFTRRVFWKEHHYTLLKAAVGLALPSRLRYLRAYLLLPYLRGLNARRRQDQGSVAHAAFYPLEDAVEIVAMLRASIRYRMLVL